MEKKRGPNWGTSTFYNIKTFDPIRNGKSPGMKSPGAQGLAPCVLHELLEFYCLLLVYNKPFLQEARLPLPRPFFKKAPSSPHPPGSENPS